MADDLATNPRRARHVAIIMDGNGRWATRRGFARTAGHHRGVERVREIVEAAPGLGIETLTLYAFSTENWHRPGYEVAVLMALFRRYIVRAVSEIDRRDIRVRFIGQRERLPMDLQRLMAQAEERTAENRGLLLQPAVSYGGRAELVRATRAIAAEVAAGRLQPDEITEETLAARLYTAGAPDPDLVIRTSGEMRISNFLLWQSAYSEYAFVEECFPDFSVDRLAGLLGEFAGRERRFGKVAAQI
ncbi:MAG: isoprenyl transferase [Pikeienuella sp.]